MLLLSVRVFSPSKQRSSRAHCGRRGLPEDVLLEGLFLLKVTSSLFLHVIVTYSMVVLQLAVRLTKDHLGSGSGHDRE